MSAQRKKLHTCSRGHRFYKSAAFPVCPACWPGRYKGLKGNLPDGLSAPALRALRAEKISSLAQLAKRSEKEIRALHGVGPSTMPALRAALKKKGLAFRA